jgi:hypothetical protein
MSQQEEGLFEPFAEGPRPLNWFDHRTNVGAPTPGRNEANESMGGGPYGNVAPEVPGIIPRSTSHRGPLWRLNQGILRRHNDLGEVPVAAIEELHGFEGAASRTVVRETPKGIPRASFRVERGSTSVVGGRRSGRCARAWLRLRRRRRAAAMPRRQPHAPGWIGLVGPSASA